MDAVDAVGAGSNFHEASVRFIVGFSMVPDGISIHRDGKYGPDNKDGNLCE